MLAHMKPDGAYFPPQRADHLDHDVEQKSELPLDSRPRYRRGGGHTVSQPIGPLGDHGIAHFGYDTTGSEQCGLRSAHEAFSWVQVCQFYSGVIMGSKPIIRPPRL